MRSGTTRLDTRATLAFIVSLAGLAIGLAGCGQPAEKPTSGQGNVSKAPPHPVTGSFNVALVTPGSVSDNGWNAGAYKGLQEVKKATGADIQNVEAKTPSEQEDSLRQYASKGYQLVFAHGAEFEDMALKMEGEFKNTYFAISSGRKVGARTIPIKLNLSEGAYLLGMTAGGMTKTNKVAQVGAQKSVPVEEVFKSFEAGVKAVNPNAVVIPPVYTNDWDNVGAAKQATLALLNQGADVVMQDVDAAAQGVFQAVQEQKKAGKRVFALGTNSNQNASAPDVILASAPIYMNKVFVEIANQVKSGKMHPDDKGFGMKGGFVDFIINPALKSQIPEPLQKSLAEKQKMITEGSFIVPRG